MFDKIGKAEPPADQPEGSGSVAVPDAGSADGGIIGDFLAQYGPQVLATVVQRPELALVVSAAFVLHKRSPAVRELVAKLLGRK